MIEGFFPSFIFFFLSGMIIVFALWMLLTHSPVSSAFALVGVLLSVAGMFALLEAHFLAAVQIFVYAGAIMVLVIFMIMLLHPEEPHDQKDGKAWQQPWKEMFKQISQAKGYWIIRGIIGLALLKIGVFTCLRFDVEPKLQGFSKASIEVLGGNVRILSQVLMRDELFSFECASVLLLLSLCGAAYLSDKGPADKAPGKKHS